MTAPAPRLTIAAATQRPGQSGSADDTAASSHEHFAAVPVAHANSDTAAVTAPVVASGYAVQVTSERSESRAQAAFRALQAKYPNQLSGYQPILASRPRRRGHLLSCSYRSLCVSEKGDQVVQRVKGRRRRLRNSEKSIVPWRALEAFLRSVSVPAFNGANPVPGPRGGRSISV